MLVIPPDGNASSATAEESEADVMVAERAPDQIASVVGVGPAFPAPYVEV